jgi:hypothetical protein
MGFGTESDFRDFNQQLVIAHDLPDATSLLAERCLEILTNHDRDLTLAINIKSDGLQPLILALINKYRIQNYFLFDMAVPDAMKSIEAGLRCFTRHSDKEPAPAFYEQASGVWMDGFDGDWITPDRIRPHLDSGKQVCLVSPELHRRHHLKLWQQIKADPDLLRNNQLMLCTDIPEAAVAYFAQ